MVLENPLFDAGVLMTRNQISLFFIPSLREARNLTKKLRKALYGKIQSASDEIEVWFSLVAERNVSIVSPCGVYVRRAAKVGVKRILENTSLSEKEILPFQTQEQILTLRKFEVVKNCCKQRHYVIMGPTIRNFNECVKP